MWIEICVSLAVAKSRNVTPLAGVWIEISERSYCIHENLVTPLAGVWIEIQLLQNVPDQTYVTPLAGVWIEIVIYVIQIHVSLSLPLRECGLKSTQQRQRRLRPDVTPLAGVWIEIQKTPNISRFLHRHSPCGSVD